MPNLLGVCLWRAAAEMVGEAIVEERDLGGVMGPELLEGAMGGLSALERVSCRSWG